MKCIYCGSDTKYKDRKDNKQCAQCHYPFAFEPKTDSNTMTDPLFKRLIQDVSGEDKVFFTEKQLWYELNRRLARKSPSMGWWGGAAGFSVVGGIALAVTASAFWPVLVGGGCGVALGIVGNKQARKRLNVRPRVSLEVFRSSYLNHWIKVHGKVAKLIPSPGLRKTLWRPVVDEDVAAYSFDRVLVSDHDDTAAMLVANNFHFENNCAILSYDGYPPGIRDTVMTMLRRNPQLKVFALHDATIEGCGLPRFLRTERWFPEPSVKVIDLGLRPSHVQKLAFVVLEAGVTTVPANLQETLTKEETEWLEAGNQAELAGMRPAKLMRAIYQGFARTNQAGWDSGTTSDGPGVIWIHDGGADVYASDSFG